MPSECITVAIFTNHFDQSPQGRLPDSLNSLLGPKIPHKNFHLYLFPVSRYWCHFILTRKDKILLLILLIQPLHNIIYWKTSNVYMPPEVVRLSWSKRVFWYSTRLHEMWWNLCSWIVSVPMHLRGVGMAYRLT